MLVVGVNSECVYFFFFFNDTATTEIYTLSLHDALPISSDTISQSDEQRQSKLLHRVNSISSEASNEGTLALYVSSGHCATAVCHLHQRRQLLTEEK